MTDNKSHSETPAVVPPHGTDPRWREKVETAKRARSLAARTRTGKPSSFRTQVGRTVA
jgi:hypothetical protein